MLRRSTDTQHTRLGNANKNTRVSEEDDPEAILECKFLHMIEYSLVWDLRLFLLGTREEWELSTEIPLKEEQLSGEKAATFTTIRSIKGEEEECSVLSGDPKAIQPLPECKFLCAK